MNNSIQTVKDQSLSTLNNNFLLSHYKRQQPLNEDLYTDILSFIVSRDFFPAVHYSRYTENEETTKHPAYGLTLDRFFSKYTSEDNASFDEIIDNINNKQKEKYSFLYNNETKTLTISNNNTLAVFNNNSNTWNYDPKNALFYVPDGTGESYLLSEDKIRSLPKQIVYRNTQINLNIV